MASLEDLANTPVQESSLYHYIPNRGVAITLITLFSISTLLHSGQVVRCKQWYLFPTVVLCGAMEIIGWSARLWSSFSPSNLTAYSIQSTCTVLAPTPLLAASFVIFGEIIKRLGTQYSRLGTKWYTIIFCSADVVSLVAQSVGGGIAASAATSEGVQQGSRIMLGGIAFQLVVIVLFSLCMAEFFYRYKHDSPLPEDRFLGTSSAGTRPSESVQHGRVSITAGLRLLRYALAFSTFVLFVRAIYRTIELSGGWSGPIMKNEFLFNFLDGAMVVLAIYTFNFCHPGMLLPPLSETSGFVQSKDGQGFALLPLSGEGPIQEREA